MSKLTEILDKLYDELVEYDDEFHLYAKHKAEQAINALVAELIGDDEGTYESPQWKVPHTAETLVAYAEGWDARGADIRKRVGL